MQKVNIRQLKADPSTAIQMAKDEDVLIVTNRATPEALLVSLDKLGFSDPDAVRVVLAVALFKSGVVSLGFAARMANKSIPDMLTLLSTQGIPIASPDLEETRRDLQEAKQWFDKSS